MLNYQAWTQRGAPPEAELRAVQAWQRIQQKPTTITVKRGNTRLPEQTVRLETSTAGRAEATGAAGTSSKQQVIVYGVLGLSAIPDTDLQPGDQFAVTGVQYRIIGVTRTLGELQATAEALA